MRATNFVSFAALLALGAWSDAAVAAGNGKSFHLVIQTRPENLARYFALPRSAYDMCVINAKAMKLPFKPFPQIPAAFVHDRRSYISDGKRLLIEETRYTLDYDQMSHLTACQAALASDSTSTLYANGRAITWYQDTNGVVTVDQPQPDLRDPVAAGILALYTEPATVKGIALKCHADGSCIVDPALVLISEGRHPVAVMSRMDETNFGIALVTEPVSLSVGKPVDPAEFTLGKAK